MPKNFKKFFNYFVVAKPKIFRYVTVQMLITLTLSKNVRNLQKESGIDKELAVGGHLKNLNCFKYFSSPHHVNKAMILQFLTMNFKVILVK